MAQEMITYGDILSSVREKLGIQSSDTLATNKIKRMINEVYLDEVVPFKRWIWLEKNLQVIHNEAYDTGTVAVTVDSATITLSTAPTGLGSFVGYRFSVSSSNQVYTIATHTANATSATITTAFQETTDATANFQIWRDRVDLPTNARETVEIWHSQRTSPLEAVGSQGFRQLEAAQPKLEGFPCFYDTWTFFDPTTSGDDETESDRYRQTRIYPSINTESVILNIDYIEEVTSLEDLTDEPLMPIGDRLVLFYGALALGYSAIARDEDMHDRYWAKFQQKLSRMSGNRDEGQDTPKLRPNPRYVNAIRRSRPGRRDWQMRRTQLYRIMPWTGGLNTSMDPGVISPQELVIADNVQFSSTGARIKREAFEYLDNEIFAPDFRASSGTTRTLTWTSHPLVNILVPDQRLVVGEEITITGNTNYNANEVLIESIAALTEVTTVLCVGDTAGSLASKYFLISGGDSGVDYYVWYKVSGSGTDPAVTGRTGIEVDITTGNSATAVATATAAMLNAMADFVSSSSTATVTVTNFDPGYTNNAANGNSGFTTTVTTQGGHRITYTADSSVSESTTAIPVDTIEVVRTSAIIWAVDYWRFVYPTNIQLLVIVNNQGQVFSLDDSGRRVQIFGQQQTTTVVTDAASTLTTGDYFLINGSNNLTNYYVWYNKAAGGGDPTVAGRTGIEVAVGGTDTATQVATATQLAIDAVSGLTATVLSTTVTITNDSAGIADPSVDFNTGFTIATTAYGATMPTAEIDTVRSTVFNERLILFFSGAGNYPVIYNPEDSTKYQLLVPNLGGTGGLQMPDASFGFVHLSRIWTNDKANIDYLHYCETFDETQWLGFGDSGAIPINPGDGDPEGILNAYVYKGFVVVAKKDSRHRVLGDSPENFQRETISNGMGNEGPFSIAVDEVDVFFASKRGFHSQQITDQYGDTNAAYLSADIKPSFVSFEAEKLNLIQGAYIPELNSVAMSITERGGQNPEDIWLYNIEAEVPGKQKPGAWYRWPNQSCTALSRRFISGKHKLIFGTTEGRVVQAQKENDFTDFGTTGIQFQIKSGTIYPGGDPQTWKAFKRITMIYRPKGNFSFAVLAKIDNQQSQGFAFNEISGLDLLGETFVLGTSILGSSNTLAPFTFTMEGYGRGVTLTITQPTADEQIEIWGFVIEWEPADLQQEVS